MFLTQNFLDNLLNRGPEIYESIGMNNSLKQTSGSGIFEFTGIEVVEQFLFGGVTSVTDEARKEMLAQVGKKFSSL
ncbi:hypothetical protein [Paenibacillus sp. MMO-58]|uniref:hypothetical protein n=1 Tax=Paenibacillus sp. MMO-58 TaxID=3081290 RepID=UPI003018D271